MTAAVQETFDIPTPVILTRDESRAAVAAAITRCARDRGIVHARWVREYLPAGVQSAHIGSVFNTLGGRGVLAPAHRAPLKSGGGSGNANKWLPVWRLTRPITPSDVA